MFLSLVFLVLFTLSGDTKKEITCKTYKSSEYFVGWNECLKLYSYIYEIHISDFLFMYFLHLNTELEGISYDRLDIYNYYNGVMYGTRYGVTYLYYLNNMIYTNKSFHDLDQSDVVLFMYKSNYRDFIKNSSPSLIYIYAFYCFRFTRYTFYYDYLNCCKEMGLDTYTDYLDKNNVLHNEVLLCIKKRFEQRYIDLMNKNPCYRIGFLNRYYKYYNESRLIDKELMKPNI